MNTLADMPLTLTVEETAGVLRIGRSAAYAAVRAGDIPSIKVGRSLRIPRFQLERMLGLANESGRVDQTRPLSQLPAGGATGDHSHDTTKSARP